MLQLPDIAVPRIGQQHIRRILGNRSDIFAISSRIIETPDLLIYLKASVPTLISQIQKRGRAYEMSIQEDYLQRLNEKYENWINNIYEGEVITLDIDKEDFIMDPKVLQPIIERISTIKSGK